MTRDRKEPLIPTPSEMSDVGDDIENNLHGVQSTEYVMDPNSNSVEVVKTRTKRPGPASNQPPGPYDGNPPSKSPRPPFDGSTPSPKLSRMSTLRRRSSQGDAPPPIFTNYDLARDSVRNLTSLPELPLPPGIKVCILIVGTHGDVTPFVGLALALQKLGHKVRVATHREHRDLVLAHEGLSFYPLAGDPHQLSKWMGQTGGTVMGEARNPHLLPEKTKVVKDIIRSAWPAVSQPDPYDPDENAWVAEAIIANPPVIGHIHVAEALGCPLHIMFPQPWYYPTKAFPHPMSGLSYVGTAGRAINYSSYDAFETLTSASFGGAINTWRRQKLELNEIRGNMSRSVVNSNVPFSALWSPNFVPKPDDWPSQCRVVGTFQMPKMNEKSGDGPKFDTSPFQYLVDWLDEGPTPIFVGFGSMHVTNPKKLSAVIHLAAKMADVRVIVQGDWFIEDVEPKEISESEMMDSTSRLLPKLPFRRSSENSKSGEMKETSASDAESDVDAGVISPTQSGETVESTERERSSSDDSSQEAHDDASEKREEEIVFEPVELKREESTVAQILHPISGPRCIKVGRCPHDWLLPKCAAVAHHGGAGTTAAGLRYGLPTLVCPFFADQFFWAAMVHRAGVGPLPCPIAEVTTPKLVDRFIELKDSSIRQKAQELAEKMDNEHGISNGLEHFLSSLPRENMLCDVGVILGEVEKAKMRLQGRRGKGLKVSLEVVALLKKLNRSRTVLHRKKFHPGLLKDLFQEFKAGRLAASYGVHSLAPHPVVTYGLDRVETTLQGCGIGIWALLVWWIRAPLQIFVRPDKFARSHGACGCIIGVFLSFFYICSFFIYGLVACLDRLLTGISNGWFGKNRLFCIDQNAHYMVHSIADCEEEIDIILARGISSTREKELIRGLDLAIAARAIFNRAGARYAKGQWHFQVAKASAIKDALRVSKGELKLSHIEVSALSDLLAKVGDQDLSFSVLCALLHETISQRPHHRPSSRNMRLLSSRGDIEGASKAFSD